MTVTEINGNLVSFENDVGAGVVSMDELNSIFEPAPEDALDEDDLYELCVDQIECQLYDLEEYVVISKGDSPTDECADCCGDDCDECPFAYDDEEDMI